MLTPAEVGYVLGHSGAIGLIAEDTLVPVAEQAAAALAGRGARRVGVRGVILERGGEPPAGWEPVDGWMAHGDAAPPEVTVADDDLAQLIYTSGTESRPKGAMLSQPQPDRAVRLVRGRRRDDRRRRGGALAAALPLRAAALLPHAGHLPGRDERGAARRRPRRHPGRRSRPSTRPSCSARRRCGSRCCATRTSTAGTCPRCARATTARRSCRWRC